MNINNWKINWLLVSKHDDNIYIWMMMYDVYNHKQNATKINEMIKSLKCKRTARAPKAEEKLSPVSMINIGLEMFF